ncbi:MAG: flagellar basal body rod protein FlgB [Tepidamorphaceae bacterium]|nr:flagellar basal body rod protein FlgB [Rhodobiaceae bacterium]
MGFFDLPILNALKTRMQFHSERQVVLAQNVANAETPGYGARDLKAPDFKRMLAAESSGVPGAPMAPVRTSANHMGGLSLSTDFKETKRDSFEVTPEGNGVVLEDEMMKIAQNQIDHQIATTVYARGISMVKRAVGRSG